MSKSEEDGEQGASPVKQRSVRADFFELIWLPALLAFAAIILTWLVWHFTTEPCTPELAKTTGCRLSGLGRYINLDLFNKMMIHGGIGFGAGGIERYIMIKALERQLAQANDRADRATKRADEFQNEADKERKKRIELEEEVIQLRRNQNGNG